MSEEKNVEEVFQCPGCGTIVDSDATRCKKCGLEFEVEETEETVEESTFTCSNCGREVNEGDTKCPNCGLVFEEEEEIAETPTEEEVKEEVKVEQTEEKPEEEEKTESAKSESVEEIEKKDEEVSLKESEEKPKEVEKVEEKEGEETAEMSIDELPRIKFNPKLDTARDAWMLISGAAFGILFIWFAIGIAPEKWYDNFVLMNGIVAGIVGLFAIGGIVVLILSLGEFSKYEFQKVGLVSVGLILALVPPLTGAFGGLVPKSWLDVYAGAMIIMPFIGLGIAIVGIILISNEKIGAFGVFCVGALALFMVPFHELIGFLSNDRYEPYDQSFVFIGAVCVIGGIVLGAVKMMQQRQLIKLIEEGDEHYSKGKYNAAVESYSNAIEISKRFYGYTLTEDGKRHAIIQSPEHETAWGNRGAALTRLGKLDDALNAFDIALKINPENKIILRNKGNALARKKMFEEAIQCFDKALEIDPDFLDALNNKGVVLVAMGDFENAIKCFDKILDINSEDPQAWNNKGRALDKMGKKKEALECYEKALELKKDFRIAEQNRKKLVELHTEMIIEKEKPDKAKEKDRAKPTKKAEPLPKVSIEEALSSTMEMLKEVEISVEEEKKEEVTTPTEVEEKKEEKDDKEKKEPSSEDLLRRLLELKID